MAKPKKEEPLPPESREDRAMRLRAQAPDPARAAYVASLSPRDRERLAPGE